MICQVRVSPNSKEARLVTGDNFLKAYVRASPKNNEANQALIILLSNHFDVDPEKIKIIRGHKSRKKIVEIK